MNILIINAHPQPGQTWSDTLATAYAEGAREAGAHVEEIRLGVLDFDPILRAGYGQEQPLEPDLQKSRLAIERADHIVFVFPVWWGTLPALFKGWIDRTFLTGWAFRYDPDQTIPTKLLKGRTAHIISTMDAPSWWYRFKHRRSAHTALRAATLDFVGIKTIAETTVFKTRTLDEAQRTVWAQRMRKKASREAAHPRTKTHKQLQGA